MRAEALDLSKELVAEELARIRHEGWSGVLALAQGEIAKGIYFVDGEVVFAVSTVEEDRLGASLLRTGKITESQFRGALRASEAAGQRVGQALVEAGLLTPADVAAAVTGQVERIVLSALRWTTGQARRESMERPIPADLALRIDTDRLLVLGMRGFPDTGRLERALGAETRHLRRAPSLPFDFEGLPPTPAERAVLALCSRAVPVWDLLRLPHPRAELVHAAYAFLVAGLIENARPGELTPPPGAAVGQGALAPARPAPGPEEAERSARSLLEKGHRAPALELLRGALERNPDAHGVRRLLAMALAREQSFEPAVEQLLLAALAEDGRDTELRYALATYYRRTGMAARAILQLRLVLSTDSSHAGAWRDLGELEASEGRRRP